MNQHLSWGLFLVGLFAFLGTFGEQIADQAHWADVLTPAFIGHMLVQLAAAGTMVAGALGIRLNNKGNPK